MFEVNDHHTNEPDGRGAAITVAVLPFRHVAAAGSARTDARSFT
jgi:hypothetical protein